LFFLDAQEEANSRKLQEMKEQLDAETAHTMDLLCRMMPVTVADRLRNGEDPANICQVGIKIACSQNVVNHCV
jgi:hypothetical protein